MLQSIPSIYPEILMTIFALLLLTIDLVAADDKKSGVGYIGIAFLGLSLLFTIPLGGQPIVGFEGMLVWDKFSYVFFMIFAIAYAMTTIGGADYMTKRGINKGEYYVILFFSIIGMMFMVSALDLSIFYLGLETMAISMYVLAGFDRNCQKSNESGIKYFIMGAFSSALLLFGLSYIYGFTGGTTYGEIAEALTAGQGQLGANVTFGLVLMLVGFAFKVSAVPFHMWAPDVYNGAPTPIAGFMTVAPKAAAFGAMIRFLLYALAPVAAKWQLFFAILAVLTMTYGNLVAIAQNNVKRMLAYSAISNAGYMLIGVVAGTKLGVQAVALYLFTYAFMNIGAFTIIGIMKNKGNIEDERLESFAGLAKKHPMMSLALLLFMFSLAGIPPLGGFIGKFYIFVSAMDSGYLWLAIVGALNSAIACYYYMRVTIFMYFKDAEYDVVAETKAGSFIATFVGVVMILAIGIFPNMFVELVKSLLV